MSTSSADDALPVRLSWAPHGPAVVTTAVPFVNRPLNWPSSVRHLQCTRAYMYQSRIFVVMVLMLVRIDRFGSHFATRAHFANARAHLVQIFAGT